MSKPRLFLGMILTSLILPVGAHAQSDATPAPCEVKWAADEDGVGQGFTLAVDGGRQITVLPILEPTQKATNLAESVALSSVVSVRSLRSDTHATEWELEKFFLNHSLEFKIPHSMAATLRTNLATGDAAVALPLAPEDMFEALRTWARLRERFTVSMVQHNVNLKKHPEYVDDLLLYAYGLIPAVFSKGKLPADGKKSYKTRDLVFSLLDPEMNEVLRASDKSWKTVTARLDELRKPSEEDAAPLTPFAAAWMLRSAREAAMLKRPPIAEENIQASSDGFQDPRVRKLVRDLFETGNRHAINGRTQADTMAKRLLERKEARVIALIGTGLVPHLAAALHAACGKP